MKKRSRPNLAFSVALETRTFVVVAGVAPWVLRFPRMPGHEWGPGLEGLRAKVRKSVSRMAGMFRTLAERTPVGAARCRNADM